MDPLTIIILAALTVLLGGLGYAWAKPIIEEARLDRLEAGVKENLERRAQERTEAARMHGPSRGARDTGEIIEDLVEWSLKEDRDEAEPAARRDLRAQGFTPMNELAQGALQSAQIPYAAFAGNAATKPIQPSDTSKTGTMTGMFHGAAAFRPPHRWPAHPVPGLHDDSQEQPAEPKTAEAPSSRDPGRAEQKRRWAAVRARLRDAQLRAAQYELDPALAIDYPAFNDVTVPEVSAMAKALRAATRLNDAATGSPIGGSRELLVELENSVGDYETAIDVAERAARKLRWSHLSATEQTDLEEIQALLNQAMDKGNPEVHRLNLYARLQTKIRRLNERHGADVVATAALGEIEARAQLMIEA
ncbi:hypothetical protein LG293_17490 (plasmid) [Citricoccus nitrophenolicus]